MTSRRRERTPWPAGPAHHVSTGTLLLLQQRLHPLAILRLADSVECSALLAQYNLARGKVWALVPLWMALAPAVLRTRS